MTEDTSYKKYPFIYKKLKKYMVSDIHFEDYLV